MDEYISREATVKAFCEKCKGYYDGHCVHRGECDIDVIKTAPAADVQPVKQWISVKDRLPDESCGCLGIVDGEVTEVNYSPKSKGYICVWSMCDADGFRPLSDDTVTHWQPLPEPPKDGDADA